MYRKIISVLICLFVFPVFSLCTPQEPSIDPDLEGSVDKGNRILGMDISNYGDEDIHGYGDALLKARDELKAELIDLHLNWDVLEGETAGDYSGLGNFSFLDSFYNDYNVKVALTIAVIDTNALTIPAYISDSTLFADMLNDFKNLIDEIFSVLPNMIANDLLILSVGNEIDVYLAEHPDRWSDWKSFYTQAKAYIETKSTGINDNLIIGTKVTVGGVFSNSQSDILNVVDGDDDILLTYYPLKGDFTVQEETVVFDDFDQLVTIFSGKQLYFLELGYPTSDACNSKKNKQALFFEKTFKAWDEHISEIPLVIFSWLCDLSQEQVDAFEDQYEISDEAFLEYLRTLGFMTYDWQEKVGFDFISAHAETRGW